MRQNFQSSFLVMLILFVGLNSTDGFHAKLLADDDHAVEAGSASEDASAEEAVEHPDYNAPPLEPEWPLFLFSLLLFIAFVFVMRASVWGPLINGLNARESRVFNAEQEAKAARHEAEKLRHEADQRLAEVQEQVKQIVSSARAEAEARKVEIVREAEQKAQQIKEQALAEIAQAREQALAELEQTVDQQVALATEHVIGRRM
ncbi:MAG: ATP synthase F0 subunit B [Planctomycetaceae bacterium]|nr:ATP synthase F0 subunit B [Planctomycetaceae bacterium]